ncbi:hypothetical protein GCM10027610_042160 [Dactylosporangium cerinum]
MPVRRYIAISAGSVQDIAAMPLTQVGLIVADIGLLSVRGSFGCGSPWAGGVEKHIESTKRLLHSSGDGRRSHDSSR